MLLEGLLGCDGVALHRLDPVCALDEFRLVRGHYHPSKVIDPVHFGVFGRDVLAQTHKPRQEG